MAFFCGLVGQATKSGGLWAYGPMGLLIAWLRMVISDGRADDIRVLRINLPEVLTHKPSEMPPALQRLQQKSGVLKSSKMCNQLGRFAADAFCLHPCRRSRSNADILRQTRKRTAKITLFKKY